MTSRAKVAVLRTTPDTVLDDYDRLLDLAEVEAYLPSDKTVILKDNISWHYPFPSANTTPWQLEGTILGLRRRGYEDLVCVQNKTVVTNAFKGEDLNNYVPVFRRHNVPVRYNFKDGDMAWVPYEPKATMNVLHRIYPKGIRVPDYFMGKSIVHLPTTKCVSGDTEVVLADGSIVPIGDLVHHQISRAHYALIEGGGQSRVEGEIDILAMDRDGRIRPFTARWFWRTAVDGRRVLRLRTRTGREITATADHLLRTPSGWAPLGKLEAGSRIAIGRHLRVDGRPQPLPQPFNKKRIGSVEPRPGRKYTAAFSQQIIDSYGRGATTTALAKEYGIPWQSIQAILRRHEIPIRGNATSIQVPERSSPGLWRWLGYVIAEGCIERGESTDKLWWVNSQPEIREDFLQLTREIFGVEPKLHNNGKHLYLYSRQLGGFLEAVGLPVPLRADNKRIPSLLFRCPDAEIAAFLSAYLDGDGSVSKKQADLTATTKSHQLAHDLQLLFTRLGAVASCRPILRTIPGKWDAPRTYYMVTVSGEGLARLADALQLRHPEKARRLAQQVDRFLAGKRPSNWDTTPMPHELFRTVRRGLGLSQSATGKASSANNIEHRYTEPTPRIARYFVNFFAEQDTQGHFGEEIAHLRTITSPDLAWDTVDAVEEVSAEGVDLFDLTVPEADCFLGNGLVLHNCHIYTTTTGAMKNAFGGLLTTNRHYTHTWIHETLVDLLHIQKEIHSGILAVMDGTTAGNGTGPRIMTPVEKNVILASGDQVAIDAIAAKMMGFDPLSIGYIRLAQEQGLGVGDPREIEVVGDDISGENWHFQVGMNFHRAMGWLAWYGPTRVLQKLIFHTPLAALTYPVSEIYHDYYRWPLKERHIYERWRREAPWGQLFAEYQQKGHLR